MMNFKVTLVVHTLIIVQLRTITTNFETYKSTVTNSKMEGQVQFSDERRCLSQSTLSHGHSNIPLLVPQLSRQQLF